MAVERFPLPCHDLAQRRQGLRGGPAGWPGGPASARGRRGRRGGRRAEAGRLVVGKQPRIQLDLPAGGQVCEQAAPHPPHGGAAGRSRGSWSGLVGEVGLVTPAGDVRASARYETIILRRLM